MIDDQLTANLEALEYSGIDQSFLTDLGDSIRSIQEAINPLLDERVDLIHQIAEIIEAGYTEAHASYREGQYLYLIYPTPRNGEKRRREYVGNKPEKVKAALEKIARYDRLQELARQLDNVERRIKTAKNHLDNYHMALSEATSTRYW